MEATFWLNSWEVGATSFHRKDIHPYIQRYAPAEALRGLRVLVPLCGKTNDMMWFREHAAHVVGVELAEKAILQFFAEQNLAYTVTAPGRYEAEGITLLQRDIFDLTVADVGQIDFVYDRAALIALPIEMRYRYLAKIDELTPVGSQQLVITLEYAPVLPEPPFTVTPQEIESYYGDNYLIEHVEQPEVPDHRMIPKFGLSFLKEHGFLITKVEETVALAV